MRPSRGLTRTPIDETACAESAPTVSLAPDSLLGTPTPASKLYDFLLSSLTPRASTYSLPLTVLLKGALGSGKRTLIRSVARRAGVGLLELDCFDLLGESDAKTEGRLRALAVDKALACAPVVLVLRNVEALARKSQAMETGQGEFARDVFSRFGGCQSCKSSLLIRGLRQLRRTAHDDRPPRLLRDDPRRLEGERSSGCCGRYDDGRREGPDGRAWPLQGGDRHSGAFTSSSSLFPGR